MNQKLQHLLNIPKQEYLMALQKEKRQFDLNKPIVLFGAGDMSFIYVSICERNGISIEGIFDNDKKKHGKQINKHEVLSPSKLSEYSKDIQIVITSVFDIEISQQLHALGFKNVWTYEYMSTVLPDIIDNPCWHNSLDDIFENKERIYKCFDLLDDSKSQNTFLELLAYRLSLDKSHLSNIAEDKKNEYFDKEIIHFSPNEVFIDGGAYVGDTIENFIEASQNIFKKILAFEPDTVTFAKLQKYVQGLNDKRIMLYPYGLGKEKKQLFFANEGTLGSRISEEGNSTIDIVKIDDYIKFGVTSIKLDIEGAEMDALAGGKSMIHELQPKMMVCLYHKTSDLWNIPLLLHEYNPSYKFMIRHYTHSLYDTICYAV